MATPSATTDSNVVTPEGSCSPYDDSDTHLRRRRPSDPIRFSWGSCLLCLGCFVAPCRMIFPGTVHATPSCSELAEMHGAPLVVAPAETLEPRAHACIIHHVATRRE